MVAPIRVVEIMNTLLTSLSTMLPSADRKFIYIIRVLQIAVDPESHSAPSINRT